MILRTKDYIIEKTKRTFAFSPTMIDFPEKARNSRYDRESNDRDLNAAFGGDRSPLHRSIKIKLEQLLVSY